MPKVGDPLGPATAELLKGKKLEMRKKSPLLSALPLLPLILFASVACAQDASDSLEVPKEVQSLEPGQILKVSISVSSESISLFGSSFLPAPENLFASVSMAKEGP